MRSDDDTDDDEVEILDVVSHAGFALGPYIFPTVPTLPLSIESFQAAANAAGEADRLANGGKWEWERSNGYAEYEAKQPGAFEAMYRGRWYDRVLKAQTDNIKNWSVILRACHFKTNGYSSQEFRDIMKQGANSLASFSTADSKKFTTWLDTVNKKVPLGIDTIQCFHALRCWVRWFQWLNGRLPFMVEFTSEQATIAWSRYSYESNLNINPLSAPDAPAKFKSFRLQAWRQFSESVMEYLAAHRGVINLPLTYLVRPSAVYTMEELNAFKQKFNPSYEAYLMKAVKIDLTVPEIAQDNIRLYSLLIPLVQDTDAYATVASLRNSRDGRALWLALTSRGDGGMNQDSRRWQAQSILFSTTLDESGRGNSQQRFDNFVRQLQTAFNELASLEEAITESEQVRILLRQLNAHQNPKYQPFLSTIVATDSMRTSFQAATNHLSSMFTITTPSNPGKTSTRNVSAVTTNGTVGRVPKEQWNAMSSEQRKAHIKKMKSNKGSTDSNNTNQKRSATDGMSRRTKQEHKRLRKVASLALELVEGFQSSGQSATPVAPTTSRNPSEQFGTQIGHKIESMKSALSQLKKDKNDD